MGWFRTSRSNYRRAPENSYRAEDMRKAALFDAGDTLLHWNVHKRQRFTWLCEQSGVALPTDPSARLRAAQAADRFFYSQLSRPDSWTDGWWTEQVATGLAEVGLPVALAGQIVARQRQLANLWTLDPDAIPVLQELKARGYQIGLVSNWDGSLAATCGELGLAQYVDFIGDSAVFGQPKPSAAFFLHVLDKLQVRPEAAFHVGDTYDADVMGAEAAGITPILLDALACEERDCLHRAADLRDVLKICDALVWERHGSL
jgi:putative hydrolase of the HAD superfamily